MINVRRNIFETNSSSNHNLTIIKDEVYDKWRNHEIAIKIEYEYDSDLDRGDGLFGTWGNFFLEQGHYEIVDIKNQKEENIKILDPYCNNPQVSDKLKDAINCYRKTGKITPPLFIEDLYLTPEEYKESLYHDDCLSPFFYRSEGVVVIGHYSRS
jgi:hypothetical protein